MELRKAIEKDWKTIQALNKKLFIHDSEFDFSLNMDWPSSEDAKSYYKDAITNEKFGTFVIENEGVIVAYIIACLENDYDYRKGAKKVEIHNIFIDEQYRKQGLGKQLFQAVESFSKDNGIDKLMVSVHAKNSNAIDFYHKIGYEDYSIEMEKDL